MRQVRRMPEAVTRILHLRWSARRGTPNRKGGPPILEFEEDKSSPRRSQLVATLFLSTALRRQEFRSTLRTARAPCYSPRRPNATERSPASPRGPGEVAEWSIAPHSKCGVRASVPGVRIPPSPPISAPCHVIVSLCNRRCFCATPTPRKGESVWATPQMYQRMYQHNDARSVASVRHAT